MNVAEDRKTLGKNSAAGERQAILGKIAAPDAALLRQTSVVERLEPTQHFEQRGFAGAVAADKADAVLWRDQPVKVLKQDFWAEAFPGSGELDHRRVFLFSHFKKMELRNGASPTVSGSPRTDCVIVNFDCYEKLD